MIDLKHKCPEDYMREQQEANFIHSIEEDTIMMLEVLASWREREPAPCDIECKGMYFNCADCYLKNEKT